MRTLKSALKKWEGHTLIQVKGSRVSSLYNVLVHKPCMQDVKHTCVSVREHAYYNTDIKLIPEVNFINVFFAQLLRTQIPKV